MKKLIVLIFITGYFYKAYTQNYNVPATGTNSIETCSGYIFDPGGEFGYYGDNQDGGILIYPDDENKVVYVTLEQLDLESCCDYLSIFPDENLPQDFGQTNIQLGQTIFSEAENGAMSVGFESDGSITASGFKIRIGCLSMNDTADITISSISFPGDYVVGSEQTLNINLFNDGMNTITSGVELRIAINDSNNYSTSEFIKSINTNPLTRGNNLVTTTIQIPSQLAEGYYYIFVETDPENNLNERIDSNNIASDSVFIESQKYDLWIREFHYPNDYLIDGVSDFTLSVSCKGNFTCDSFKVETFLSVDKFLDSSDFELNELTDFYNNSCNVTVDIPESINLPDSLFHLITYIQSGCDIFESDTSNNMIIKKVVTKSLTIDLTAKNLISPDTLVSNFGNNIQQVISCISNLSSVSFKTELYISGDSVIDDADYKLANNDFYCYYNNDISYTTYLSTPADLTGEKYLILSVDPDNLISENDESNNLFVKKVKIDFADYDLELACASYEYSYTSDYLKINTTIRNNGTTSNYYTDLMYYLSNDSIIDEQDELLDITNAYTPAPKSTYLQERYIYYGGYDVVDKYLIIVLDYSNAIEEINENNNQKIQKIKPIESSGISTDFIYRSKRVIIADSGMIKDNGGLGNYFDNSNDTLIIIPATTGKKIKLTKNFLNIDNWSDSLFVFSGIISDSTNYILLNKHNGLTRAPYYSIDTTGAISLVFTSNINSNDLGFEFEFECVDIDETIPSDIYFTQFTSSKDTVSQSENIQLKVYSEIENIYLDYIQFNIYISTDSVFNDSDQIIYTGYFQSILETKSPLSFVANIYFPNFEPGIYYLIAMADKDNVYQEGNELNNTIVKKLIVPELYVDFNVLNISTNKSICYRNKNNVVDVVINKKGYPGFPYVLSEVYLSNDTILDQYDNLLNQFNTYIYAGEYTSYQGLYFILTDTVPEGKYYLFVNINSDSSVVETNYSNNTCFIPIYLIDEQSDIIFSSIEAPDSISINEYCPINFTLKNIGNTASNGYMNIDFYLSNDSVWDGSDYHITSADTYLDLEIYEVLTSNFYLWPEILSAGQKFVIGVIGGYTDYPYNDMNTENNILYKPIYIHPLSIDLQIYPQNIPSTIVLDNGSEEISYSICNLRDASGFYTQVEVFISTDTIIDNNDNRIANSNSYMYSGCNTKEYWFNCSEFPSPGTYYLIARCSHPDDIDSTNNIVFTEVKADYSFYDVYLSDFTIDGGLIDVMTGNKVISGNLVYGNNGTVNSRSTYLNYCLSKDTIIDPNDEFVFSSFLFNIEPGISFNSVYSFITPWFVSPRYIYLIATLDYPSVFMDEDRNNNTIILKVAEGPSSVNVQNEEQEILVFPNIVTDYVTVQNNSLNNMHLTITDNLGRIVFSEDSKSGELTIDMSYYDSGFYFLQILNEENKTLIENCKLIKQ